MPQKKKQNFFGGGGGGGGNINEQGQRGVVDKNLFLKVGYSKSEVMNQRRLTKQSHKNNY